VALLLARLSLPARPAMMIHRQVHHEFPTTGRLPSPNCMTIPRRLAMGTACL